MVSLDEVLEVLEMENPDARLLEPRGQYDAYIVGLGYRFNEGPYVAYSIDRIMDGLLGSGMTDEEASEYFDSNIAFLTDNAPIFIKAVLWETSLRFTRGIV